MTNQTRAATNLSEEIQACVRRALEEDISSGDATTNSIVSPNAKATARIIAKQDGIASGLEVARAVFLMLDAEMECTPSVTDGSRVVRGQTLMEIIGSARALLTGERSALNFIGRMSGIATLTRQFVDAVAGTRAVMLDTRKTAPGLRAIDKRAGRHGGGKNHRTGLYDMILIKDNHIEHAGSIPEAVLGVLASNSNLEIEVETRTIDDVEEALAFGVKRILLDNMSPEELRQAVTLSAGRAKLEASGNITLENVREIADTGVDFISVGALTHSAKAFDASLQWLR